MEKIPVFLMFKNQKSWTIKCLENLCKNTDKNTFKLIAINNGSNRSISKKIEDFINSNFEDPIIVQYDQSVGVSFGFMDAIKKYAEKDCFVILHNDVFVTNGWLTRLLSHKDRIEEDGEVEWSCIFPRTNYSTEETPTAYDKDIKEIFNKKKIFSKSFITKNDIEENLKEIYFEFSGLENYAEEVKNSNKDFFKIVQEICGFCTLFNKNAFLNSGGFDHNFIKWRGECKLLNNILMYDSYYPIMAMDVYVHHHGNLTTDGPGANFAKDFKESEKIYKERLLDFHSKASVEEIKNTKLAEGMSYLFIRDGGVGDIVMSMFALQGLKNKFPNVSISYMTKRENMGFVKSFSCIDEVLPINMSYDFSYSEKDSTDHHEKISILQERYDQVKNWIKHVEYYDKRDVHRIVKFSDSISIKDISPCIPEYNIGRLAEEKIRDLFGEIKEEKIVICMDGTCDIRSIPKEVGHKIIDLESKKGKKVFLVGNSKPLNLEDFEAKENIVDIGFTLKIEELAALIKQSSYVYTPDTGIFHIASLLKVPCKAFFGSIDPELRDGGYYEISNKIYYKKGILPCVPCRDLGCKDIPCMKYTEEEIKQIVEERC